MSKKSLSDILRDQKEEWAQKQPDKRIGALVSNGVPIECTKEEYPELRRQLQEQAGKYADWNDGLRAMMCLNEVKKLDDKYKEQLSS